MNYAQWRDDIFGHSEDSDPIMTDLKDETYELSERKSLDFIDRMLQDTEIHSKYSPAQIGNGLNIVLNSSCSDIPFHYIVNRQKPKNELRKIESIKNLRFLYSNYFAKYCHEPVVEIGFSSNPSSMSSLCYMFWDIFVLYPGNATDAMLEAGIGVMKESLKLNNDNCIESTIHGLGHWMFDTKSASSILDQWLLAPNTKNEAILKYANQARTGCIE